MVCSVTEGEDKPMKYPLMFRACELVVINKIDLLDHLEFDLDKFLYFLDQVHPGVERMLVSARTGEGSTAGGTGCSGSRSGSGRSREHARAVGLARPPGGAAPRRAPRGFSAVLRTRI